MIRTFVTTLFGIVSIGIALFFAFGCGMEADKNARKNDGGRNMSDTHDPLVLKPFFISCLCAVIGIVFLLVR